MKRCPQCAREYDLTMSFCLDDGSELLYGPAAADEPATAVLPAGPVSGESQTRAQFHTTERTAILPTGSDAETQTGSGSTSRGRGSMVARSVVAAVAIIAVAGIGFVIYKFTSGAKQTASAPSFESM